MNNPLKYKKIFIAGHRGMVGSALVRYLKKQGAKKLILVTRKKLDLLNHDKVYKFIKYKKPDVIINCAGRVGGILANSKYPVEFLDVPLIYKYGGHADQLSKVNDGIESYRIQSLEKIINSGFLSDEQKVMAVNALVNKMKIYSKGLKKRKKLDALQDIKKNIQYWINMI